MMNKYIWNVDKSKNKWSDIIYENLIDKNIEPKDLTSRDKLEFICNDHGKFSRRIDNLYNDINTLGRPNCPKCSRIEATKKAEKTNMERYGTKAPAQNSAVLDKMKATNQERYGFDSVGSNPNFMEKIKQSNLEKYGVEHAITNPEVKGKANQTMIEKYGTVHALQNEDSFNKFKSTMNERYNSDFSLQNKELRDKFTQSMKEKYDVEHALQNEEFKQKMRDTNVQKYNALSVSQTYEGYVNIQLSKGCIPVSEEIFNIVNNAELLSEYIDTLTEQNGAKPTIKRISELLGLALSTVGQKIIKHGLQNKIYYLGGESYSEYEVMEFLDNFSIKYKHRYKKLGPELDIYIEDHDLGIELNGLYWHSDEFKEKTYHLDKKNYYKDIGIKVIHIYEDEWLDETRQEIIKSIILSACNISVNKTIDYARKLKLVELDHSTSTLEKVRNFYNENHLQGYRTSSVHVALVDDNDDIIECMSFGYAYYGNRKNKNKYQYELIRHCTKLYHNVVGGKERIFKYFTNNHPYDKTYDNYIITYCDIDKFSGTSYEKLGFSYVDHQIQVWGIEEGYTKRTYRNPHNNDHFKTLPKIYGCGNNVYIYNCKHET